MGIPYIKCVLEELRKTNSQNSQPTQVLKVTTHSNNRNSKSLREVIVGSDRLRQSVILRNYDMIPTGSNARYTARW